MFPCHHPLFVAVLLAAVLTASIDQQGVSAQTRAQGPAFDDTRPPNAIVGAPRGESAAFDALGNEWVTSRLDTLRFDAATEGSLATPDLFSRDVTPADIAGARASGNYAWAVASRPKAEPTTRRPRFRIADALASAGAATGTLSVRSAASASQAEARRAIVNALARTPLGKALGRVFLIHRDDPENGPDADAPSSWSKAFPLLNPRLNARTRTVGMSFVWRF